MAMTVVTETSSMMVRVSFAASCIAEGVSAFLKPKRFVGPH